MFAAWLLRYCTTTEWQYTTTTMNNCKCLVYALHRNDISH